ncbi:hypothetical protein A4X13_0g8195 [Tilletia indica]|uniref:Uncharacterized protein n=1 Tax=Tilletia indica TaxID=43049 RepID=A0A177TY88_9BASI|nr:hypothetical protein A4X13_0g8195 [Tilletia indica]
MTGTLQLGWTGGFGREEDLPSKAVVTAAKGTTAGVLVREVRPGVAIGRGVLTDGSPLTLGQVRTSTLPVEFFACVLVEANLFLRLSATVGGGAGSALKEATGIASMNSLLGELVRI